MQATVKPQGCTNLKLRQLVRRVGRLYDAQMAAAGLKTTQYSLLSHVVRMGPVRPVDLARAMQMDSSTLTRNLQPLVAAGWAELLPGPDARSRLVRATPAGRDKRQQAQRLWRAAQERLNEQLGAGRVVALHALIDDCLLRLADPEAGDDEEEHPGD